MGLTHCNVNQAIFYRRDAELLVVMAVHIDDCIIAAKPASVVDDPKRKFTDHIEITNLGKLHWLLGIKIEHD